MREILLRRGYSVRLFAESIDPKCAGIADPISKVPDHFWQSPEDILIYHHSMGWGLGEQILSTARNRIVVRYHNVTPARFFARYSSAYYEACAAGRQATQRIARVPDMLLVGDSTVNCNDMIALGTPAENCRVLSPLHKIEELAQEHFDIPTIQRYAGEAVNLLFVGGVKPNKGHGRAIRAFAAYYHQFNRRSRLIFAGGVDDRLRNYVEELRRLAASLGVADHVVFTGSVCASELKSLYVAADVFLCTSEHEGFCVPLVEAMYFRVPIVAWGRTAVPETLGDCGFLLDHWDESLFASRIEELISNAEQTMRFGDLGRRRYEEMFSPAVLETQLSQIITEVVDRPSVRYRTAVSDL
jgi:glycosyltransferase involved in cell wall biosynthesis